MSELVSIVYKPQDGPRMEGTYTRVPVKQTTLVADYGIAGDEKGGAKRQLNIMSAETVKQLECEGFYALPGQLGEQLIVAGLDVDALPIGAQIQIGESACVEYVEPRTGCGRFEEYQGKARQDAAGRLGIMARVVVGGPIQVGDTVQLLEKASAAE